MVTVQVQNVRAEIARAGFKVRSFRVRSEKQIKHDRGLRYVEHSGRAVAIPVHDARFSDADALRLLRRGKLWGKRMTVEHEDGRSTTFWTFSNVDDQGYGWAGKDVFYTHYRSVTIGANGRVQSYRLVRFAEVSGVSTVESIERAEAR